MLFESMVAFNFLFPPMYSTINFYSPYIQTILGYT